ncbi:Membrane-associated phosphatidylinositol transfer protein 2 [Ameca splendens]|uniref:Membrane-associated phosphatidylinositol transfer protein 2 n=2 Tax=Goodeidae TaxID=28758 RepID=A0ABV0XDN6_9TELE
MMALLVGVAGLNPRTVRFRRCVLGQDTSPSWPADGGQRARWHRLYGSLTSVSLPQGSCGYNVAYLLAALRPACQQVYNLFHPADPSASRLEPLLDKRFHLLPPFSIPRYQRFPLGDGHSALLVDTVQSNPQLLMESGGATSHRYHESPASETSILVPVLNSQTSLVHTEADTLQSHLYADGLCPASTSPGVPHLRCSRRASEASIASQVSGLADSYTATNIATIASRWWGSKRMDYALYCPDALTAFPTVALPHLFHASYWESTDVVSFLLRQVMRHENSSILELDGEEVSEFTPSKPREKWLRKRTHVKIRNVTANHRVNDVVFTEDGVQTVTGRFMYGPLDMVTLTGEKIDIHIMTQPPSGEWVYFDTELTNSSGRISYVIPANKRLGIGVYPVKMVVRGDHTFADSYLSVVPKGTEFVVFSIDGSFAASVSIMGSDPKVRAGAVDVVRFWQDLGYLIVYVTGRPDMQKQRVVAWLSQHNFPHGIVSFCDGLVHDPLRHKANFLKSLIGEAHMRIFAAYGSAKDISVYSSIGLPPSQIYIVGRPTKKMQHQCQFIPDGYASHLSQLEYNQRSRPAKSSTRMVLRKGSFALGAAGGDFLRKRNHIFRTNFSQQPGGSSSASQPVRTERTLSQCEGERERSFATATQRSMSMAAGCWGRGNKEGPK